MKVEKLRVEELKRKLKSLEDHSTYVKTMQPFKINLQISCYPTLQP